MSAQGSWRPYTGSGSIALSVLLVVVALLVIAALCITLRGSSVAFAFDAFTFLVSVTPRSNRLCALASGPVQFNSRTRLPVRAR
jgi:hypothetical protein